MKIIFMIPILLGLILSRGISERFHIEQSKPMLVFDEENKILSDNRIEQKIGQMLMVGFFGTEAPSESRICQDIRNYNLGGVILFDVNPVNKKKAKNISSKTQLEKLTRQLQACSSDGNLLIAVDQEGGKVQRLKTKYGFYGKFPKAKNIANTTIKETKKTYEHMSNELMSVGINFNLAPVVDLAINPQNVVINKLGRSYGSEPGKVVEYASTFMDSMYANGILTSLKHFPGHGSSLGDTHEGFVDITSSWQTKELEPYQVMIDNGKVDTIMAAHVFNANLDKRYPSSLSKNTITDLLRNQMGFDGVVITDDLQMGAIIKQYNLEEILTLSIHAGVDILLFGNQLNPKNTLSTKILIDDIKKLVKERKIDVIQVELAYQRIQKLKKRLISYKK